ncbi:hypothetical protein DL240_14085 [Lujinxingia litoralis]|uniref:FHA domain-containing protein n=2 Tax=Lujinxingia litoralis TaxID=2211119 RepID=A0A328C3B2_9DELT|nr:hypothetical protein DL240_14085 [Lujinxingia litoralis]
MSVELGPQAPVVSIGRATDCTIRSNRKSVSRRHAEFRYSGGRYEIVDLNSSNGTYLMINEERTPVSPSEVLQDLDEVWCGDFILRFYEEAGGVQPGGIGMGAGSGGFAQQGGLQVHEGYDANRVTHDFGQEDMAAYAPTGGMGPGQGGMGPGQGGMGPGQGGMGPGQGGMGPGQGSMGPGQGFGGDFGEEDAFGVGFGGEAVSSGQFAGLNEASASYDDVLAIDPRELAGEVSEVPDFQAGSGPYGGGAGDVQAERLREEKLALEELAARQADELEGLRHQVEALQRQTRPGSDDEIERLAGELRRAQEERQGLDAELARARQASQEVGKERERAHEAERRLEEATGRIDELRERAESAESDAQTHRSDVASLQRELEQVRDELRGLRGGGSAREELEQTRGEVARQERLLGEFERRNRDLQAEQQDLQAELASLRQVRGDLHGKLEGAQARQAELEAQVETLHAERRRAEAAEQALEEARQAGAALQEQERDLRGEIEGLKQRLKLERERSRGATETSLPDLGALRAKLESLDRIVDAIERTDLQPLSTVDRVRLQSAIRDTAPRRTLKELMDAFGAE